MLTLDVGIKAETKHASRKNRPPEKWKKYSGSSLSCVLAAGLAAQIIYCARLVGHEKRDSLKTYDGMNAALRSINITPQKWLPVRTVFGNPELAKAIGANDKKKCLQKHVVEKLLTNVDSPGKAK